MVRTRLFYIWKVWYIYTVCTTYYILLLLYTKETLLTLYTYYILHCCCCCWRQALVVKGQGRDRQGRTHLLVRVSPARILSAQRAQQQRTWRWSCVCECVYAAIIIPLAAAAAVVPNAHTAQRARPADWRRITYLSVEYLLLLCFWNYLHTATHGCCVPHRQE